MAQISILIPQVISFKHLLKLDFPQHFGSQRGVRCTWLRWGEISSSSLPRNGFPPSIPHSGFMVFERLRCFPAQGNVYFVSISIKTWLVKLKKKNQVQSSRHTVEAKPLVPWQDVPPLQPGRTLGYTTGSANQGEATLPSRLHYHTQGKEELQSNYGGRGQHIMNYTVKYYSKPWVKIAGPAHLTQARNVKFT